MSPLPLKRWVPPPDLELSPEQLPNMYELPSENPEEPGLPDDFHYYQPQLLRETFRPPGYPMEHVYVATDLNLYYDARHPSWYKRPDWFAVLGVPRFYQGRELRFSYVIWQESITPFIVVELLSAGTEKEDLGQTLREVTQPPSKWQVYEQLLQVPYYVVFSREVNELQVFRWQAGRYQALPLSEGRVWLPEIQLGLGLWLGDYQGLERQWLRWYDAQHQWLPTLLEQAEQERQRADQERQRADQECQRADQERQRVEQLMAQLKALGIEPKL